MYIFSSVTLRNVVVARRTKSSKLQQKTPRRQQPNSQGPSMALFIRTMTISQAPFVNYNTTHTLCGIHNKCAITFDLFEFGGANTMLQTLRMCKERLQIMFGTARHQGPMHSKPIFAQLLCESKVLCDPPWSSLYTQNARNAQTDLVRHEKMEKPCQRWTNRVPACAPNSS